MHAQTDNPSFNPCIDPQPEILPGMVKPAANSIPVDEVSRFEAEGGKPAQTPEERRQRARAERKVRFEQRVEQVKSLAADAQSHGERLLCAIRKEPVKSAAIALGLGWLAGRIWPR